MRAPMITAQLGVFACSSMYVTALSDVYPNTSATGGYFTNTTVAAHVPSFSSNLMFSSTCLTVVLEIHVIVGIL